MALANPSPISVPKEHGFWVMMAVALIASIGRAGWQLFPIAIALASGLTAIVLGGVLHNTIRRKPWAQLAASPALAFLLIPAEVTAGLPWRLILTDVLAWMFLFLGCSLAVRATFARGRKRKQQNSVAKGPLLAAASIAFPALLGVLLLLLNSTSAQIDFIGATGLLGVAIWRPIPKQLKAAGLAMAGILVVTLIGQIALGGLI